MNFKHFIRNQIPRFVVIKLPSLKKNRVIFWGHLGLGDQISSATIIEYLLTKNSSIVIPTKERNCNFMRATFGTWEGVVIEEIDNNPLFEELEILRLKLKYWYPIKIVGHGLLYKMNLDTDGLSLNAKFNFLAGVQYKNLTSLRFRSTCEKLPQAQIPITDYVFVDDHPLTEREIPDIYLQENIKQGIEVLKNDIAIPLFSLVNIMDNAKEAHFIASAPLCFALTIGIKSQKKFYYRTTNQGLVASEAYPDWVDIDLRK
jgi:hypothetical protein